MVRPDAADAERPRRDPLQTDLYEGDRDRAVCSDSSLAATEAASRIARSLLREAKDGVGSTEGISSDMEPPFCMCAVIAPRGVFTNWFSCKTPTG